MKITPDTLTDFVLDFDKAVNDLEKKYGVTISLGKITYEKDRFYTKMMVNNSQDPEKIAEQNFDAEVWKYDDIGLKPGMYRQMFLSPSGEKFAILGFDPNARKYPLRVVRFAAGKYFRAPKSIIKEIIPGKYIENQKRDTSEN